MKTTKLRVDDQFFHIDPSQDTDALRRDILAAAQDKPMYVHFSAIGHGEVSVLMAPGMCARFEVQEMSDEDLREFEANPPFVDFDSYRAA